MVGPGGNGQYGATSSKRVHARTDGMLGERVVKRNGVDITVATQKADRREAMASSGNVAKRCVHAYCARNCSDANAVSLASWKHRFCPLPFCVSQSRLVQDTATVAWLSRAAQLEAPSG